MPEGPSLVIAREELAAFAGKKVLVSEGNSKAPIESLKGKKLLAVRSWGKHLLLCFDEFYVRIHFLMFGSYLVNAVKDRAPRLSLRFRNGSVNFYSCSVKVIEGDAEADYDWSKDTMSPDWDPALALKNVKLAGNRMICDVLMDQEIFAGVGNIIKNEVLFITKIHPESITIKIPLKLRKQMVEAVRTYCFDFFEWKKKFELRKHWRVYKKFYCPDCEIKLQRRKTGIGKRGSFFCEHCQKRYES